jgi:hypothetical protein
MSSKPKRGPKAARKPPAPSGPEAARKPPARSGPDDWSDPSRHGQMSAALPIAIFAILLLGLIAYGFFG